MMTSLRAIAPPSLLLVLAIAGCTATHPGVPASRYAAGAPALPPAEEFEPNAEELALGELLTRSPEQRRKALAYSPVLARVARQKAMDMVLRGYFAHVDRDGLGANTLVERAGYPLPESYEHALTGNNIESLGLNQPSAEAVWRTWMRSQAHRSHLLGLNPVFAEQDEFGVGYVRTRGIPAGHYWVVLIARRRPEPG